MSDSGVKPFTFVGRLPASKSVLNRLLIVQSYADQLQIRGDSDCEDVNLMRAGLSDLVENKPMHAGSAGTVLRFLALRASRIPRHHRIVGSRRLFARPQDELGKILRQVGVRATFSDDSLEIEGEGWKMHGDTLLISSAHSSQFASGVLLNSWGLPFDLYVSLGGARVSEGYWRMTVEMAQTLGMKIDFWDADFRVVRGQRPVATDFHAESDMSSAFSLAAIAAICGQATFLDFPLNSLQPDAGFVMILESMGAKTSLIKGNLKVEKAPRLGGVRVNLKSSPDLFPVLAALCALAEGDSDLFGAPHLIYKESNRLEHLAGWIRELGREVTIKSDGMTITGPALKPRDGKQYKFDCDQDHRLAFAAAVFKAAGFKLEILHPESVTKSFPDYWKILGWDL